MVVVSKTTQLETRVCWYVELFYTSTENYLTAGFETWMETSPVLVLTFEHNVQYNHYWLDDMAMSMFVLYHLAYVVWQINLLFNTILFDGCILLEAFVTPAEQMIFPIL